MGRNLLSNLKEKPAKYGVQTYLGIKFIDWTMSEFPHWQERMSNNGELIHRLTGDIGYTITNATPALCSGTVMLAGFVSIVGAGMFMEKYYYKNPQELLDS